MTKRLLFFLSFLFLFPLVSNAQLISTTTCPGAGCVDLSVGGQGSIGIQITGTWAGTITFQGSLGSSSGTFVSLLVVPSTSTTAVTTTTGNGVWSASIAGYNTVRVVFTAYTSGTASITRRTTTASKGLGTTFGSAATSPGGADTQVQFNDAGVFGGDSGLTWVKADNTLLILEPGAVIPDTPAFPALLTLSTVNEDLYYGLSILNQLYNTDPNEGILFWQRNDGRGEIDASQGFIISSGGQISLHGNVLDLGSTVTNNLTTVVESNGGSRYGSIISAVMATTDDIDTLWGVEASIYMDDTSNVTDVYGVDSHMRLSDTASVTTAAYGYRARVTKDAGFTLPLYYGYFGDSVVGIATNPYFLWYDGGGSDCNAGGVYRVNQFGISAYYNPCFAAYTPGSANFERIIQRFGDTGVYGTDNRAYVGVEVGGTGTDRALHLTGANLSITSTLTPAVTDTTANSCGTGTQTIVGNDNAGKVTVIGSAGTSCTVTFATAFLNAPSCVATDETTAILTKAISTTTTAIVSGVFSQNDVISYVCLGR